MLRAGATQAPEPCRVEYGAASLQKVNRASPGACYGIGKRPRNLERAEWELDNLQGRDSTASRAQNETSVGVRYTQCKHPRPWRGRDGRVLLLRGCGPPVAIRVYRLPAHSKGYHFCYGRW